MCSQSNHTPFRLGVLATLALACASASAQELEFPISPNPVGAGARAAGMADAFVAVADDATAASWNPAGLVQLERPEISFVGSFNAIQERFDAAGHPEFVSTQRDHNFDINFLSAVYPLPFLVAGRNVTTSLSFQQKFDLSRQFNTDFMTSTSPFPGSTITSLKNIDFTQDGGLSTITPAVAFELTHTLSLGVAVNLWRENPFGDSGWTQRIERMTELSLNGGTPVIMNSMVTDSYDDFRGENVSIGLLWNVTDRWNLGVRYDSTLRAKADFSRIETTATGPLPDEREQRDVRIPDAWSLGTAFRPNDRLTLALDVTLRRWEDFFYTTAAGEHFSLVDGSNLDDPATASKFDPTKTIRFGVEYLFIPKEPDERMPRLWTVRGGIFYDEEPASGRSTINLTDPGDGDPDKFFGAAGGVGLLAFQRVNVDLAYQLRYGPSANSDFFRGVPGFKEDVFQHRLLLSTVIYF